MAERKTHKGDGLRRRLRERFLNSGLSGFHDYEVIELLLTLATPRRDCKEIAKAALKRFKTLQGVLEASPGELCEIDGLGPVNIFGIRLIKEVADRFLKERMLGKDPIRNAREVFDYLYYNMKDKHRERFKVIYLDVRNQILAAETLFEGTLTSGAVYPREVVQQALTHRAAALIFAHNHPSGDPKPSPEDVAITRQLLFACKVVGITVHEHLVIGDNRYFSFADEGYIADMNREFERYGA
ncbi:MAG: DNA repair protein RadC [Desulfococcus multivorans]|jgi:DNA repair protein RadC|nr:DNA repair protein RadC [Desulfococcus multivorans]